MSSNAPAGSSWRNWAHYSQLMADRPQAFKRYDYESDEANMKVYNQTTPPDYELHKLDFPIAMFKGRSDLLADPQDVDWVHEKLAKTVVFFKEYDLGHLSFLIADDMSFFTVDAMAVINHYNNQTSFE